MKFFLKTGTFTVQILSRLRVLRESGHFRLFFQIMQFAVPGLCKPLFTSLNIHGKLFKIQEILFIHFVHHCRILEQTNLMLFQCICNLFYIYFSLVISVFQIFYFICLFFEKSQKTFFLFGIKSLQFSNNS